MKINSSFRDLLLGLLLFIGGIFLILSNARISISWFFKAGNLYVPTILLLIPLLGGLILKLKDNENNFADKVIFLSIIIIILSIINSIKLQLINVSFIELIIIIIIIVSGIIFILKSLFFSESIIKKKKD